MRKYGGESVIRINIPSTKGHTQLPLETLDGQRMVSDHLQMGWIASINGRQIRDSQTIRDNDEVNLYPPIAGG